MGSRQRDYPGLPVRSDGVHLARVKEATNIQGPKAKTEEDRENERIEDQVKKER